MSVVGNTDIKVGTDADLILDGGAYPAFSFSDQDVYENIIANLAR